MADYSIKLGIDLDTSDLQGKINKAGTEAKPIPIKLEIENLNDIKKQIQSLGDTKTNKSLLRFDTESLEASLRDVSTAIKDIKASLGTLDDKSGMKSLLSSVNQIATALGKVENESDNLVKSLSALSKKDFSINFDLKMGGSNPVTRNTNFGRKVRNEVLPELQKQVKAYEDYFAKYYEGKYRKGSSPLSGLLTGSSVWEKNKTNVIDINQRMADPSNLEEQIKAYKQYISIIKEAASLKGIDVSSVASQFSTSAEKLVKDTIDIKTGAKEAEEHLNKLKGIFGGSLDVEGLSGQLQPIIADLGEIKTALQSLSSNNSIDGLTQSFNRLSETLEKLTANLTLAKNTLDTGFSNTASVDNAVRTAQQTGQKIGETINKSAKQSINIDDVIDEQVLDLMQTFSIAGDKVSNAFKEIRQALVECRNELNILKNSDISIDEEVFDTSRAFDKVSDAIANQIRAVNSLGDEYVELAKYMKNFNDPKKGNKVRVPDFIKQEQGDDYKSSRGTLGIAFNTEKGISFASFIEDLNHELGIAIDLTNGEEKAYEELVHKLRLGREQLEAQKKSQTSLQANASTDDILTQNYINKNEIRDVAESAVDYINAAEAAEKALAQASTQSANTVSQNEERKQQAYRETANALRQISGFDSAQRELKNLNFNTKSLDIMIDDFNKLGVQVKDISHILNKDGSITFSVIGADKLGNTVKAIKTLDSSGNFKSFSSSVSQSLKESDKFIKQQKKSVSDLTNQINQLNRSAIDQNANRPIKDSSHLDTLKGKYNEIISAIQRMGDASSNTFDEEANNVRTLISEYKSLTKEFRNAENVSSKMKGTDFASGLDIAKNDLEKFKAQAKDFPQITATIEKLDRAVEGVGDKSSLDSFTDKLKVARAELAKVKAETIAANRKEKVGIDVSGATSRIADIQRISPEIDDFKARINGAEVTVESLLNDLSKVNTAGDFSVVNKRLRAFEEAAKSAGIAVTEAVTKISSVNKIKNKLSDTGFNGFEQELRRAHEEAEKLESSTPDLEAALKRLDVAMDAVYSADQANDTKRLVAANEEYENSLKQVYSQLKLLQQEEKQAYNAEILNQKKASLSSDMEIWLKENTRAARDFGEEVRRLQASLDGLDDNGVRLASKQFNNLKKQAQAMGKTGLTVFDKLKAKAKEYMAYLSAAEMFMYAEQALRAMFDTVKEIDTAMTGLYRVTDLTSAEYDALFNNMISSAKEYGATLNDIINATTDWVRAGFDANTSLGLAEVTTMYQHISDLDYGTAAENLITAYNGFKDELNGAFGGDQVAAVEYIADIFNELDNNFAVTSAGLGEALTRSASALDLAGNSIQETAGMVTGIVEVTQDPEKAGSALKVLSLRLRGMKGQLEELGEETDENVENISKMQGQILNMTKGKVNIFDGAGNFKSTYEIMKGIAEVWDDLSSIDQANLLETIAGKNRANDVAALLSNWENVEAAVKSASEAEGSAARENAKYVDSIQGRLDKMTTSWQSFANTFMSSDFLKGAISALTSFIEGLEKVVDTVGTFPTLMGTVAAGFSLFKNGGIFKTLTSDLDGFINKIGIANRSFADLANAFNFGKTSGGLKGGLSAIKNSLSGGLTKSDIANIQAYNKEIRSGTSAQTAWYRTMQTSSKSAKGSEVALNGMKAATIGSKVALIGAKVAAVAFNAALTMGISLLIDWAVSGIQKLINAKKDLAEEVEEITSKFKEQHDELQKLKGDYDTSNESSMISKYEKLSRGVDNLGRNVSLTADEYSEYQGIVGKIADQFPSLISGYDEQGNALLSCKGNVEELTTAYEKLIHAQNQQILTNTKDIEKNFKNQSKDAGDISFWEQLGRSTPIVNWFTNPEDLPTDVVKKLENALNNPDSIKGNWLDAGWDEWDRESLKKALKDAGVDVKWYQDELSVLRDTLKNDPAKIKGIIDDHYEQFAEIVEQQKTIAQAKLSEAFDISSAISGLNYEGISEELQAIAYQTVNNLDFEFFSDLEEQGKTVEQWTTEMLNQLNSITKKDNAKIEAAFDLQTQFNGGDISYGEYVEGLENAGKLIERLNLKPELESQLKLSLGLDENGLVAGYKKLKNRLADSTEFNIMPSEYESFLKDLSADEVSVLWKVIPELEATDYKEKIGDIKAALEKEMMLQGLTFDLNLEVEAAGIEALNTALAESVTGSGLSSESIAALRGRYADLEAQGYDLSVMFEETSHGIHINREEFNKFEKELSSQKIAEIDGDLKEMKKTYDKLGQQIRECDDPVRKSELFSERQLLGQRIAEAAELATQYKGLTSAYNDWIAAEEAGSERDMYENVLKGFETVGDEISRGWIDDGTTEFLELIKGEKATIIDGNGVKKEINIATASAKELKQVWKDLDKNIQHTTYSVRDFFTVDEDGNSTSKGVYNFLDAIGQMEEEKFGGKDVVKRDGKGNVIAFDFQIAGGDKAIAEALGISEELVQIMKRAAEDAGFVVSLDGTYKEYTVLENEARAAVKTLKELSKENEKLKKAGGDFEFDFDTTSVKSLEEDLKQANKILGTFKDKDGNIDLKADGAIEAMQIVSTLQARLDDLKSEQYGIGLTVEDEEFEEPLENLQEYGRTVAELNQLKINPNVNSERIEQLEGELDNIAEEFNNLPDEKKIKLGLVGKDGKTPLDNAEDIKKKIESGEVKIPTVLDIQANMDKNLEDLKKLALLGSGLLDPEQEEKIKLEILADIEVKANNVDDSDVDKKVDETVNSDGGGKKKRSVGGGTFEKKTDVKVKAEKVDTIDVEETVEGACKGALGGTKKVEKEVEVDLIAKQANDLEIAELIKDYSPIKQKVIVEYFVEHSEVDKYTPEQKKALVEFIANTDNLDSYTPEEKQAIVEYLTDSADPDSWTPEQKEAIARFIRESGDVDSYTPDQKEAIAKFIRDSIDPDTYTPPSPTSTVTFLKDASDVDTYDPPNFTRYVTYYAKKAFTTGANAGEKALENRFGIVNGTANSDGSAFVGGTGKCFKQGDWRTKRTETALTGELGREIVVTPQNRWYTVGDNGAEFVNIPRGSIVFNHRQTEELLRNGKVTSDGGRAKALINGSAFLGGTAHRGEGEWVGVDVPSFKVGYDYSASSDSDSKKSQNIFDWIEVAIERIEREINNLDKKANNVYKSWSSRNKALADEIDKVGNEIALQQKAYDGYIHAANQVGLSSEWANKVKSGAIDIDNVTDETLAEKIKDYQKYYEQALDCKDAILELKETESSLYAQRFENIQTQYDGILQGYEHTEAMLNEYISQAEEQGYIVSKKYYQALINNEKFNISELKKEQAELIAERDNAVAEGKITKGSEAWYEQCAAIDEVAQAIEESTTALLEFDNAMRDIDWQIFDLIQERISDITAESEFLIELMSNKDLFDDNGKFTERGVATVGLHALNYNTSMYQADDYGKEVAKLDKQIAKDPYDQELINRRRELIELQRESILEAENQKNAIKDLVEEGINLELDALQERIDLHNEELDSMKDLYDYQKNVEEQTKNIASLRKQLGAYEGFDDEETRAKVQELKVSLEEAEADLQETEYDKFISDQTALLDTLYTEYESILNSRIDNIDFLLEQVIDGINAAAGADGALTTALGENGAIALALGSSTTTIGETLKTEVGNVGTKLSTAMSNIWIGDGSGKAVLDLYGKDFQNRSTTANDALNSIKTNVNAMVDDVDKDAKNKVEAKKTTTSAKKNSTTTTTNANKNTATTNKESSNKSKATDDQLMGIAASIWIYGHDSGWGNDPVRSGKLTEKFDSETAKKVQSLINKHGSNGDLYNFWIKKGKNLDKYKYSAFKFGAKDIDETQLAWTQEGRKQEFIVRPSDGAILTPIAKRDSVLNAVASNNIWDMANSPTEFIRDNLGIGSANVPSAQNVNNNITQHFENITFSMPNVHGYNDLLTEMQRDPKFEKLVLSMTIDRIAGRSSLAKGKSIR